MKFKRFHIKIPQAKLDELHERLKKMIWPAVISGQNYGCPELAPIKDLARKALNLPFQALSFANFTHMKIDASDLGVNAATG